MILLVKCAVIAASLLLAGFVSIVVWKLLNGEISLDGLLESPDSRGNLSFSPARAQLLALTVIVASKYFLAVIQNLQRDSLPGLPVEWVAALGGSQAVFLGAKTVSMILSQLKNSKLK